MGRQRAHAPADGLPDARVTAVDLLADALPAVAPPAHAARLATRSSPHPSAARGPILRSQR